MTWPDQPDHLARCRYDNAPLELVIEPPIVHLCGKEPQHVPERLPVGATLRPGLIIQRCSSCKVLFTYAHILEGE